MANVPVTQEAASAQWSADNFELGANEPARQLLAADPQRRNATIYSDPNSAGVLYLTPNSGSTRGGIILRPGAGFTFYTGAAVYGRATGADVLVNVESETGATC